jgi:hypothetical protein
VLVPENIVKAVHVATNHAEVAEAQRMRDAEFWAHAYTWRAPSRFKRDKFYASKLRARGTDVARKYRAKYGDRAERALLDTGHRVRNTVEVTLCAAAIHYLRRNP